MLNDIKNNAQTRMAKSIDALKHTLTSIRTGRATPALLDRVTVNAYGNASTPLNQVASISNPDAHSLLVTPFDKSMIKEIEKGLYNAEFTPNTLGTAIRINMPPLTEERRRDLAKTVKGIAEESRVRIRSCRIDSAFADEKMPMNDSIPVFDRISANSAEKPAVTSSSPMISSAMFAFIRSVCLFTSSSVAFSTSSVTPWSIFDRASSILLVIAEIFA